RFTAWVVWLISERSAARRVASSFSCWSRRARPSFSVFNSAINWSISGLLKSHPACGVGFFADAAICACRAFKSFRGLSRAAAVTRNSTAPIPAATQLDCNSLIMSIPARGRTRIHKPCRSRALVGQVVHQFLLGQLQPPVVGSFLLFVILV